jgi:hypothetical protein
MGPVMTDLLSHWARTLQGLTPSPRHTAGPRGKAAPSWNCVEGWLTELARQQARMCASTPHYNRFDRTARWLTAGRIRTLTDHDEATALAGLLRKARYPGPDIHGLERVWSRPELGILITEATNRARQLAMGRQSPRARGARLDPAYLPDDRLEALIQQHRDLQVVEALRAERRRREDARSAATGV